MFGRRCFQLRRPVSRLVGAVSNCADVVRLETAPTGVIARIFPSPVQSVQLILNFTMVRCKRFIEDIEDAIYNGYPDGLKRHVKSIAVRIIGVEFRHKL